MGSIVAQGLGKAYKQYPTRWSRLAEWALPGPPRHHLHWVLRDVSFHVNPGEAVGIVGNNGAGKSTLLKLITGTTQASSGTVAVEGRVSALLELGMGFHPDFTGRQNVYMSGQLLGLSLHEIAALMPQIEAFADIGEYLDQPVRIYSSGMQVRLAFSVATARRPDVLIVDEALSVGDAVFQHKSFARIREFRAQGTTLLLVSHDLAAVRSLCDRALWIDRGIVQMSGDTAPVMDAYFTSIYSSQQDVRGARAAKRADAGTAPADAGTAPPADDPRRDPADCREAQREAAGVRSDVRVVAFDKDAASWGSGAVRIRSAALLDPDGAPVTWTLGGKPVTLAIEAEALEDRDAVFLGFMVKDRTSQALFGDNTFLRYHDAPVSVRAGTRIRARFSFRMPVLPKGTYAIAVAAATGTQMSHVIEEWIDEAMFFDSHNEFTVQGMIGIPVWDIELTTRPA